MQFEAGKLPQLQNHRGHSKLLQNDLLFLIPVQHDTKNLGTPSFQKWFGGWKEAQKK